MASEVMHLYFDEATGHILNAEGGIFAFEEFPERPMEFFNYSRAKDYMDGIKDCGPYEMHICNSAWDEE